MKENILQELYYLHYKMLQNNTGLKILYKEDVDYYKIVIIINNWGRTNIKTEKNLTDIRKKVPFLDEFIMADKSKNFVYMTIILSHGKNDRIKMNQKNVMYFGTKQSKYELHDYYFDEEWKALKEAKREAELSKRYFFKKNKSCYSVFPITTWAFILLSIFVFLMGPDAVKYGISLAAVQQRNYFTLVTYNFLHTNLLHLLNNCISFFILGSLLERKVGNLHFVLLVMFSGIYAGAASVVYKYLTLTSVPTIGLSGIVFSVSGALVVYRISEKMSCVSIIMYLLFSFITSFLNPGIDSAIHLGGLMCGIMITIIYLIYCHISKTVLLKNIAEIKYRRMNR